MMTGVTKLTKLAVFSGLTHLTDLSLSPRFATLPTQWLSRGVVLDREGAAILRSRGVDTGEGAAGSVRRIGSWSLGENAAGGKFAVCDKGWTEIDCGEATPEPEPVREIWRFFTGEDIPVCAKGACGVHLLAKRRTDGALAVLETK